MLNTSFAYFVFEELFVWGFNELVRFLSVSMEFVIDGNLGLCKDIALRYEMLMVIVV